MYTHSMSKKEQKVENCIVPAGELHCNVRHTGAESLRGLGPDLGPIITSLAQRSVFFRSFK